MKVRLSNSQIDSYQDCKRLWYLDKVERIRTKTKGSALLFGSAIDAAVETMLLNLKDGTDNNAYDVFVETMKTFEINGVNRNIADDLILVKFFASDIQEDIVEDAIDLINDFVDSLGLEPINLKVFLEYCKQERKAKKPLDNELQLIYNYIAYLSINLKGEMFLPVIQDWIDENVAEVVSIQQKIEIENECGDGFIGYLDFIVRMKDGRTVLIDMKTSSNTNAYYPAGCVEESRQLAIYSQETEITEAAYLVIDKKIRKREPRVRLTFIEGIITEEQLDEVFAEIEENTIEIKENLAKGIKAFPENRDSCNRFGGCQYRALCYHDVMTGLEKVK